MEVEPAAVEIGEEERFDTPDASGLADAVLNFDPRDVDPRACRANADRFTTARFRDKLVGFLEDALAGRIETPS